jgi:alpha-tubulin suppressor-like RCC1 family protein
MDNSPDETGFQIERKTELTGTWSTTFTVSANITAYSDTTITPGNTYYYYVRAYNLLGTSAYSNIVDTTPATPSNLSLAVISSSRLDLSWNDNSSNEMGFMLERSYNGISFAQITTLNTNTISYSDTTVTPGNTYAYRVCSYHDFGQSLPSNEVSGIPILFPPTSLSITASLLSHIDMKWNDNSIDEDGFAIERKTGDNGTYQQIGTVGQNATSYSDTNLVVGQRYYYQVKAYNGATESTYSNIVNTTVNFPSLLICRVISASQIDLSWNDISPSDETGFKIERKINSGDWQTLGTVGVNIDKYSDISALGFSSADIYYYRVLFVKGLEEYIYTNQPAIMISRVWVDVVAGTNYNIARDNNGMLWSWGNNSNGQLGFGDIGNRWFPDLIGTDSDWSLMACSKDQSTMIFFSLALRNNGTLWAWGDNSEGQLGFGNTTFNPWEPVQVGTQSDWSRIAAGKAHSLAIKTNKTMYSWGYNSYGQLGLGLNDNDDRNTPTSIGTSSDWSAIAAGYEYSLAIKTNLTLWAWGFNDKGQLGGYDISSKYTPAKIGSLSDWSSIAAGNKHTIGLKTNSTLWTWGYNLYGQLGLGDFADKHTLTQVGTQSDWLLAMGGNYHTIAIKTDKTLWIWGYNNKSQLGLDDTVNRNIPTQVGIETDWIKASGGYYHTIALKTDGTIWSWGNNSSGQLGLGDTVSRNAPCKFNTPTPPSNISATISALSEINLSWQDNAVSEDGFKIERKTEGGSYAQIGTSGRNIITYTDTAGLSENVVYYYRVKSYNSDGDSPLSNEVKIVNSVTLPDAPTGLSATAYSFMRINLSWSDNSNNELGVKIDRKTWITGTYSTEFILLTTNITSYSDTACDDNTTYYYQIRSYNNFGVSSYSNEVNATTLPFIPLLPLSFTATAISGTKITLSWINNPENNIINMPESNPKYTIERSYDGISFAVFGTNVNFAWVTWSDTTVTPTNTYYYRMKASNNNGESSYANVVFATTPFDSAAAPSGLNATPVSISQVRLSWTDNSSYESGFEIERSPITNTNYAFIDTVGPNITSYLDSGLSFNELYYYRVRGYNGSINSSYSNEISITATLLTPLITATVISSTRIDLIWTDVDSEDGYKIERKTDGTYSQIGTTNTDITSYSDTTVISHTAYYYRVMAYKGSVDGPYSISATAITSRSWFIVAAGNSHTIARTYSGDIWAWGLNDYGQLGLGDGDNRIKPNHIGGIPSPHPALTATLISLTQIDLIWSDTANENSFEILRSVNYTAYSLLTTLNSNVTSYSDTTVISNTIYAYRIKSINNAGDILSSEVYIDIPDTYAPQSSSMDSYPTPSLDTDWYKIAAGNSYTISIKNNGTLWSWGANGYGQLGMGNTNEDYNNIAQVGNNSDWSLISAGSSHVISIKTNCTIWLWGYNNKGQLGLGDTGINRNTPTQIGSLSYWSIVAAGNSHSIALKTDSTLWSWGNNQYGQLGLNDTNNRTTPSQFNANSDWLTIIAGSDHTLSIKTNGTLWSWGRNNNGQLGLGDSGTATYRKTPTQIGNASDWATIAAGDTHTIARKTDNTIWAWGFNNMGQLGFLPTVRRMTPTQIGTDSNWVVISAAFNQSFGIKSTNALFSWGDNTYGQLGLGDSGTNRITPTLIGE